MRATAALLLLGSLPLLGCSSPTEQCIARFVEGPAMQKVRSDPWVIYYLTGANKAFKSASPPRALSGDLSIHRIDDGILIQAEKPLSQNGFAADVKTVCDFAAKRGLELQSTMHSTRPLKLPGS
jgi:hypothetical protein